MRFVISSAALLMLSCQSPIRAQRQPIINGTIDQDHPFVVGLTDNIGDSFCTGTYVGDRTIVTAAHCFEGGPPPSFVYFGINIDLDADRCNDGDASACDRFIPVELEGSGPHPDFNPDTDANDIGVVKLSREPLGVAPSLFLRIDEGNGFSLNDEGASVVFSGFGVTNGQTQAENGLLLKVDGIIDKIGPDANIIGGGIDRNMIFYTQESGGPCSGDSGGPMFLTRDGVEFLAGVTSFGDPDCVAFGVSTRVDTFTDLITGALPPGDPAALEDIGCGVSSPQKKSRLLMFWGVFLALSLLHRKRASI
jgi:hypothetical protein